MMNVAAIFQLLQGLIPVVESLIGAVGQINHPMAQTHVDQASQHLATLKDAMASMPPALDEGA